MPTQLEERIYQMLTTSTGSHMLDSGGAYGRHWQSNQERTIEEFINEPEQQKQIDTGAVPEVTSESTVATDEPIQREKIEPIQQSEQLPSEINAQTEGMI
jgi:hypothetical protein